MSKAMAANGPCDSWTGLRGLAWGGRFAGVQKQHCPWLDPQSMPISEAVYRGDLQGRKIDFHRLMGAGGGVRNQGCAHFDLRSEERRVGEEGRFRWAASPSKK